MVTSHAPDSRRARRQADAARRIAARRWLGLSAAIAVAVVAAVVLLSIPRGPVAEGADAGAPLVERPPVAETLPVPRIEAAPGVCESPDVQAALAAGDDEAVVRAAGGGEAFRAAVAAGAAPCISLTDVNRQWVVVNKQHQLDPVDAAPASLGSPSATRSIRPVVIRPDAAAALDALVAAAQQAGAGEIGVLSSYRSFGIQQQTYAQNVSAEGQAEADLSSARPGHSEHQTGTTVDVIACGAGGCGGLDDFGGTAQAAWVAEHAWEFGFILRYPDGATGITGYKYEPWHLRYLGPELARAYHDGGWGTLEEFFGLPPAPDYAG